MRQGVEDITQSQINLILYREKGNNGVEERIREWQKLIKEKNLNVLSYKDFIEKGEIVKNPLFLPSLFENQSVDWKKIKKGTDGEIYTECENLFYYIVKGTEVKGKTLLIYNLDPENDYVLIENINLNSREVFYEKKKLFTPYGVKEFLKFRGFYVKEIWGDIPFGKVTFNTKTLLLRMVKYGN